MFDMFPLLLGQKCFLYETVFVYASRAAMKIAAVRQARAEDLRVL